MPTTAPYGSWASPITTEVVTTHAISFGSITVDGDDLYWHEGRPNEGGRQVIVRRTADGQIADVTPPPFNARSRVHEYGGAAFAVDRGTVYFSNFVDQRLYRQDPGAAPRPLTPAVDLRYADGVVDRARGRLICVREDHRGEPHEAINTIVGVDLERGGEGQVLASGNNFYSSPRLSPDGARLAWLTWNHPTMPWDGNELWIAEVTFDGSLAPAILVAGGPTESIFQPSWAPDGTLYFISDRSDWWNLYRFRAGAVEPVHLVEADVGVPEWNFGLTTYAFTGDGRVVCTYADAAGRRLAVVEPSTGAVSYVETPDTAIGFLHRIGSHVAYVGGSPTTRPAVVLVDLATGARTVIRHAAELTVDPSYLSRPSAIEFPTNNGQTAHGYFYPPANPDFLAPGSERPPLIVISHGGPTSSTSTTLNLAYQYWTSRGFAIFDVNYGGSSGYGRAYRQRLNGQWGVVDIDDCVNGALYLVERGLVDGNRLVIRGSSAGGYTTLSALTFRDAFKGGASYYGISDLETMTRDTHKFESRYLDTLIGPYPERRDLYLERSAIHHLDRLSCPVIFFQGLEDKIVPPNQAEVMVAALRAKKLPVAYVAFEGEQHGFRKATSIKRALEAELYFYSRIFGFELADKIDPVEIENL
ncbi:MAG TPA: S9 family peptidase [Chloroflexota bacterium]|nr:S9 family peptidase [Chloroflexota bacterium]